MVASAIDLLIYPIVSNGSGSYKNTLVEVKIPPPGSRAKNDRAARSKQSK